MTEQPPEPTTETILSEGCHPTPRGAWVCTPQACNKDKGMCPADLVWELYK